MHPPPVPYPIGEHIQGIDPYASGDPGANHHSTMPHSHPADETLRARLFLFRLGNSRHNKFLPV